MISFTKGTYNTISNTDKSKNTETLYMCTDKAGIWLGNNRLDNISVEVEPAVDTYYNIPCLNTADNNKIYCTNKGGIELNTAKSILRIGSSNITGSHSIIIGSDNDSSKKYNLLIGNGLTAINDSEVILGNYNISKTNQIFSIGNGTSQTRNNALSIMNNNDIYIHYGNKEECLQDILIQRTTKPVMHMGTANTSYTIKPNILYVWDTIETLDIYFDENTVSQDSYNEYLIQFSSGEKPTTISLPVNIKWLNNEPIAINKNRTYQISIINNMAVAGAFY